MSFIKTLPPEQSPEVAAVNDKMKGMFGMTPQVFVAMNLRPDLLEPLLEYVNRLLIAESQLSRVTKELIAAHVSKLNACAY
jgi:alkylhydroperoxidase family enzyme